MGSYYQPFKYKREHIPLFRYIEGPLYSTNEGYAYVFLAFLLVK